jgi:hypothetical protein
LILNGQDEPSGYMFLTMIDDEEQVIDQISVPINFLEPHMSVSLALKMCKGESTIFVVFNLQTKRLPEDSLDSLVSFGIKWVDFDPIPNDNNFFFSLMVGKSGHTIGDRIEHA